MSEEELVTAGTVSDKVDDEKVALEKKQKNKRKRWLLEETKKANSRGVCYLSRVPPHMDPKKLRQTLSQYGELERVYLTPEDAESLVHRKKSGVFRGKEFSEGWVEFTDKRVAKRVASMLNGEQIGGRKRSSFYYDLWNIKYLSKFKWDDLTEEIAYKSATREQKLALELSAAKRERDFYLHKSDQSTAINNMAERLKKKKNIELKPKQVRAFPQKKSFGNGTGDNKDQISMDTLKGVFGGS